MKIEQNSRLLFIGDSITDCGRAVPVGECNGLGNGYVSMVNAFLQAYYPKRKIRVTNMGTSGNTVRDLKARWQHDVIPLAPDWLSIMIGINDVWRHFDSALQPEIQVSLQEYRSTLLALTREIRPSLKGLVIMAPYFLETNTEEPMRQMMDVYSRAAAEVAQEVGAIYVDIQSVFDCYLETQHSMSLSGDRIHPNLTGHLLIAQAFLCAVDFDWHLLTCQHVHEDFMVTSKRI
jgi:lysophospholipase L1-like esterase